jgi:hypothetical protein
MIALKIEKLLNDEENLEEVLSFLKDHIKTVEYYTTGVLKTNLTANAEEAIQAMNELNAAYNVLNVAYEISDTIKKGKELKKRTTLKINKAKKNKKITDGQAAAQASLFVQDYRRIRNIIGAYKTDADKSISNLQSILKYLGITYTKPQEG